MDLTKIIEVSITALKVTSRDKWLTDRIKVYGDSIYEHPNYLVLKGDRKLFDWWMVSLGRDANKRYQQMLDIMDNIKKEGQKEPIVIDSHFQIIDGHKRTGIMAFLGFETIKAVRE
jgi:urease accessory protein UreH